MEIMSFRNPKTIERKPIIFFFISLIRVTELFGEDRNKTKKQT